MLNESSTSALPKQWRVIRCLKKYPLWLQLSGSIFLLFQLGLIQLNHTLFLWSERCPVGKRAHHQRSKRDASGWSPDVHCGAKWKLRLPLLLHDKVRLVVGTAPEPWQRHTRNRLPEKTFADEVARVLGGLTKSTFTACLLLWQTRATFILHGHTDGHRHGGKGDDCTLSGLSLGEAASKHSVPVISELWLCRK